MKKLDDIIKEKTSLKNYKATIDITVDLIFPSFDITAAGETATSEADIIAEHIGNYGYTVTGTELTLIDELKNTNEANEDNSNVSILNSAPDEELEKEIVDIFDIVEKRLNKLSFNDKEKALVNLQHRLNKILD